MRMFEILPRQQVNRSSPPYGVRQGFGSDEPVLIMGPQCDGDAIGRHPWLRTKVLGVRVPSVAPILWQQENPKSYRLTMF